MAKTRALARSSFGRPIIIQQAPSRTRRAGRRVVAVARRGGRYVRRNYARALPTTGILMAGAAVGYMQGKGFLDRLPTVMGSKMMTLGVAGYVATRFFKSPNIRLAGFAALAAAAFDWGRVQGGGASGWGDDY